MMPMPLRFLTLPVMLLATALLAACGESGPVAPQLSEEEITALRVRAEDFSGMDAQTLASREDARALGHELVDAHCASCHGLDGTNPPRGRGIPNLALAVFDYGDSAADIRTTIAQGRHSVMPPLGGQMGEVEIGALVAHVQSLSGGKAPTTFARTAAELYEQHCVVCHGEDGKGNPLLGAPDLTDDYWIYGDAMMEIRLNITRGLDVQCPAHADTLTPAEMELMTAYVLSLRQ